MPSKTVRLIRVLLKPFQDLETVFQQLLMRSVENSTGVTLTLIGKLVGQEREGVTDDELFRRYVRARIFANRSTMTGEEIIQIAVLVVNDPDATIEVQSVGPAAYELTVAGAVVTDDVATVLVKFLSIATGTAIRFTSITYPANESEMFAFDGGTGDGWGSTLDASVGGVFASARS